MARAPITQQTSTTLPLQGEFGRSAPQPRAAFGARRVRGPLQWALEGAGWRVLRPAVDLVFLCLAVLVALGTQGTFHADAVRAPLLAFPLAVLLLFYLRGLYRTR